MNNLMLFIKHFLFLFKPSSSFAMNKHEKKGVYDFFLYLFRLQGLKQ